MGYANHMQEIFHPCPPDEKSESEVIASFRVFHSWFHCGVLFTCLCFPLYAFYGMRISDICFPPL